MTVQSLVRRATEADLEVVKTLRRDFFDSQIKAGLLDLPIDLDAMIDTSTGSIIAGRRNDVFVYETDKVEGYLYAATRIVPGYAKPAVSVIEEFFITSQQRGTGAANVLLKNVMEVLDTRGADRIQLRVLAGNAAGRAFWSRTGFVENVHILELNEMKSK